MKKYDVIGIGSSLLDITYEIDDDILSDLGFNKSEMTLIDKSRSQEIFNKLNNLNNKISPGGSSSNTIAGISLIGGKAAFLGKIGNDSKGEIYEKETNDLGIITNFKKLDNEITGHAITFITKDKERTFATHLGAAIYFTKEDVIEDLIKESKILHLEGYSVEVPLLKEALLHAIDIAKNNDVKISIDLSDPRVIRENLDFITELIKNSVDIVFVNEAEAEALTGKTPNDAIIDISKMCDIAIVKLGKNGSLIKTHDELFKIPSYNVVVNNTNGAGDSYAAGLLYGLTKDLPLDKSGTLGSYVASLVVSNPSARLNQEDLEKIKDFFKNL
ncbi:adenosine kinase [Candidatus Pacearchaeota archaeon]|nr:adenosine kinase [Candidatus Pacearchaeota archaeon]